MAPKKVGAKAKKEEVIEIPNTAALPDGEKSVWMGGSWCALQSLSCIEELTENGIEAIRVMPGSITETPGVRAAADGTASAPAAGEENSRLIVAGSISVEGQLSSATEATRAAYEAKRAPKAAADGEEGAEDPIADADEAGEEGEEGAELAGPKRPDPLYADYSIEFVGDIIVEGRRPPIEVKPVEIPVAKAAAPTKGKKKVDEAALREREEALQRERERAIAEAKAEEERLAQFAQPSVYPQLAFKNIAFRGRLQIRKAHVTFENCHFAGDGNHIALVHQYCKVSFVKCTFAFAARAAIYCYPLAEVSIQNCAFTGVRQFTSPEAQQQLDATPKLKKDYEKEKADALANTNSVGVFADDAKVTIRESVFSFLAIGVAFNGNCAESLLEGNFFDDIQSIGVYSNGGKADIMKNVINPCGYYGIQFVNRCGGKVMYNTVESTVQVAEGARPLLHTNTLATKLIDFNDKGTLCMEPKY